MAVDPTRVGDLASTDFRYLFSMGVAIPTASIGSFGRPVPRQAAAIIVSSTAAVYFQLEGSPDNNVAKVGAFLLPVNSVVLIPLELESDITPGAFNPSGATATLGIIVLVRRRRIAKLPGFE